MATVLAPSRADRAFERLYRRYVADVYRYVLAVLHNEADAEDATQTAFLQAYRAYERGERAEKPLNWLIAIAHNVCRQRFRESARRPRLVELEDNVAARHGDDEAPNAEEIRRALGFLAFNQRAALVMRELQGRSYGEIGLILGLSTSAVETLLFRARRAMREQLEGGLSCGEAELALSKRADGQLSFAERGPLRAHLRECPECAALERGQRFRRRAIKSLGAVPLPSSLGSFFGGGAAVGTGVGLGAKAAAVVVAGVLGSGLAGDAIKERTMGVEEPVAEAATRSALVKQGAQKPHARVQSRTRTARAASVRRRPASARVLTPAAVAPAAAAAGPPSPSVPSDAATTAAPAPESSSPPALPSESPASPAVPGIPAPSAPSPPTAAPADPPAVPQPQPPELPALPAPPEPQLPAAPPLPRLDLPSAPTLPRLDLPSAPTLPEKTLPKLPTVPKLPELTAPSIQVPKVRAELPPAPTVSGP
jgi:RNA polymerase sigma factor (sigma-70 family)